MQPTPTAHHPFNHPEAMQSEIAALLHEQRRHRTRRRTGTVLRFALSTALVGWGWYASDWRAWLCVLVVVATLALLEAIARRQCQDETRAGDVRLAELRARLKLRQPRSNGV